MNSISNISLQQRFFQRLIWGTVYFVSENENIEVCLESYIIVEI